MTLDRQSITGRDFPIGPDGYAPEAVDDHLAAVAQEVEALRRGTQRHADQSFARIAGERVQSIVEVAEKSAAEILRDAEDQAIQVLRHAQDEATRLRAEAVERSREHFRRVSDVAGDVLERADAMEQEHIALIAAMRTRADQLRAGLTLLGSSVEELYTDDEDRAESRAPMPARPEGAAEQSARYGPEAEVVPDFLRAGTGTSTSTRAEPRERAASASSPVIDDLSFEDDDREEARLIALDMTLNGTPRDDIDRYLAANFDLADRRGLLDEIDNLV